MTARILLIFFIILLSCSKEEAKYEPKPRSDPYKLYEDAYQAFEKGDYFYAQKKFSEAEPPLIPAIYEVSEPLGNR